MTNSLKGLDGVYVTLALILTNILRIYWIKMAKKIVSN